MKRVSLVILFFLITFSGFANDGEKTYLILFDKSELKELRTSPAYLELSLMNLFKTKSYGGNSDAAIIVKVPPGNMDKDQLGDMVIRVNNKYITTLDEVAIKIIDLDESKNLYLHYMVGIEDKGSKPKKPLREIRSVSSN